MKTADKKYVSSMIKALERFEDAQGKMSKEGWSELNENMFDLDESSFATWNDISAFKSDHKEVLNN